MPFFHNHVEIKKCSSDEINRLDSVIEIYRNAFPDSMKSMLGPEMCDIYFQEVLRDQNHTLFTAIEKHKTIGILVCNMDVERPIGKRWLYTDKWLLFTEIIRNPVILSVIAKRTITTAIKQFYQSACRKNFNTGVSKQKRFESYIDEIAVHHEYMGKGIGYRLLMHCLSFSEKYNKKCVKLTVEKNNFKAIRLYEKAGFQKIYENNLMGTLIYEYKLGKLNT